jgi:hypothetical protein
MAIGYPLVAGDRFDASSIELKLNGKKYIGIKQLKYKQSLEPGEVRGLSPQVLGFTRGQYKVEGSIQIYREEFQDLITDLSLIAVGLLEANFLATINYSEKNPLNGSLPTGVVGSDMTDQIVGMRFTSTDHSVDAGSSDPLVVELPFLARYLLIGNIPPLSNLLRVAQVAAS